MLRIVSMVFIIMRHYTTQVNWGGWTVDGYCFNTLLLQLITIGGSTANNIFLLISGYHMIRSGPRLKNILLLIAELFFYSWVIAAILFGFRIIPFSIKEAIYAAFPLWFGYNWYVCCYVVFCCFVPFLNGYLRSISQGTYRRLLAVSLFLWSFCYTFKATTYLGADFSVDHFIVMYMLGGYIRLYGLKCRYIKNWNLAGAVLAALLALSVVTLSVGGRLLHSDTLIARATHFTEATSILDVAAATAIFLAVIQARPFYSKRINTLAASVVGIFLLHHNPLLKQVIWQMIFPNVNYLHSPWLPLHMLIKVTAVFTVCLSIDLLRRRFLEPPFSRWLDRVLAGPAAEKLRSKFDRLAERI